MNHPDSSSRPDGRRYLPLLMTVVVVAVALLSYRYQSENAKLAAPPFGELHGQDFRQILRASREAHEGKDLYRHAIPFAKNPSFAEFAWWNAAPYPYPPVAAVLATPLLRLQEPTALKVWTALNWLLLATSVVMAVQAFAGAAPAGRPQQLILVLAFAAVYGPNHLALQFGQLDISILFLLVSTFLLHRHNSRVAGLPLGLAIALKPIVAPMLVYFAWKRQWRFVWISAATVTGLVSWSFFAVGWHQFPDFVEVNRLWASSPMLAYPFNQSVNGYVTRLFTANAYIEPLYLMPGLAHAVRLAAIALAAGCWLLTVSRDENRLLPSGGVEYAMTLTTMMLVAPLVDDVHFVWVLLPVVVLLLVLATDVNGTKSLLLLAVSFGVALYLAHPDLHDAVYRGSESLTEGAGLVERRFVLLTGAYLFGLIGLHLCLVAFLTTRGQGAPRRDRPR